MKKFYIVAVAVFLIINSKNIKAQSLPNDCFVRFGGTVGPTCQGNREIYLITGSSILGTLTPSCNQTYSVVSSLPIGQQFRIRTHFAGAPGGNCLWTKRVLLLSINV